MTADKAFFDTNILLYLLSDESGKADHAEKIMLTGGTISVQVLNEFASVAARKLGLSVAEIREILQTIRAFCDTQPVTEEIHDHGLVIAERFGFSIYDSMILSAALNSDCTLLYSEDFQHGQRIDDRLRISNPFRS